MGICMVFLGYYWDISAIVSRKFLSELRIYGPFSGLFYWSSLNQALNQIREGWGSFGRVGGASGGLGELRECWGSFGRVGGASGRLGEIRGT